MSKRLSDEQLDAIAAFTDEYVAAMDGRESRTWQDAANGLVLLLAEVRRLRAMEARVRELVDSGDLRWKADGEDIDEAVRDALDGITRDWSGQIITTEDA